MKHMALSTAKKTTSLAENKELLAQKAVQPNFVNEKNLHRASLVYLKLLGVCSLFEVMKKVLIEEFTFTSPNVTLQFTTPSNETAELISATCSGYDRTNNTIKLDLINAAMWDYEVLFFELLHEFRHKMQLDGKEGEDKLSMYSRFATTTRKDSSMLWTLDEYEIDAEEFAFSYGKKLLMDAGFTQKTHPKVFNYIKEVIKSNKKEIIKSKIRYAFRASHLKERQSAYECLQTYHWLLTYFNEKAKTVEIKNKSGGVYNIKIIELYNLIKDNPSQKELVKRYYTLIKTKRVSEHNIHKTGIDAIGALSVLDTDLLYYLNQEKKFITDKNASYVLSAIFLKAYDMQYETGYATINQHEVAQAFMYYKFMHEKGLNIIDNGGELSYEGQKEMELALKQIREEEFSEQE